jgi:hypothetical protein
MLLECNSPEVLIVKLDHVPDANDNSLVRLASVANCVFICPEGERKAALERQLGRSAIVRNLELSLPVDMLLTRLLRELHRQPYEAVFITGNPQEIYLAASLGVATILYTKESTDYNHMPDHEAEDISDLLKCLNGEIYGYFGELFAHGISGTGLFKEFQIEHLLDPDTKATLFVGGRYFTSSDRRTYIHPLSHRILGLKNGWTGYVRRMGDLLARTIKVYMRWGDFDILTAVPPRPGRDNRHIPVLNAAISQADGDFLPAAKVQPNLLRTVRDYDEQKFAGSHTNRFLNVYNAFQATRAVSGHVLLFDDIVTSGATALECARMLYHAGADKVSIIAFGASQSTLGPRNGDMEEIQCERESCEGTYRLRFNNRDNSAFFGCTNYKVCGSRGLPYDVVRRKHNLRNAIDTDNPSDLGNRNNF